MNKTTYGGKRMNERKNNNAPDSPQRRKALKKLAVGVGALAGSTVLPEEWITPVVRGIALPVHAQTSAPTSAPSVNFCTPVEMTLVDGHSGTDEMTVEASGCITPAQANVDLEFTLLGYDAPVITRNDKVDDGESFLAAVSEALVPSAHAGQVPVCTVKVKVKTDAEGNFKATFKLKCGKGIVQVVLNGLLYGQLIGIIGCLDIHGCNPCGEHHTPATPATLEPPECANLINDEVLIINHTSEDVSWGGSITIAVGTWVVGRCDTGDITAPSPHTIIATTCHGASRYNMATDCVVCSTVMVLYDSAARIWTCTN
jgi:hypothetical protein